MTPSLTYLDISDTLLALSPGLVRVISTNGRGKSLQHLWLDGCNCANKGQVWGGPLSSLLSP